MKKIFLLPSLLLGLSQMTACAMLDALQLCVNDGTLFGCADLLVDPDPNNDDAGVNPNDAGDADAGITDAGETDAGSIEKDAGIVDADAGSIEDDAGNANAGIKAAITPEQAREYPHWPIPIGPTLEQYQNNNDGTFTDLITGLMWLSQVEMDSQTQPNANTLCEGSNASNHSDWRLPTRAELLSLVNVANNNPSSVLLQIPSNLFWTASRVPNDATRAWIIDFSRGFDAQESEASSLRLICVRTEISNSTNDPLPAQYLITAETAHDVFTGLMWQREVDLQKHSHANALELCEDLVLDGFADWRLPHIQELRSIVDVTNNSPAIDPQVFPNTPNDFFWSATELAGDSNQAWRTDFAVGDAYDADKNNTEYVRCVRSF